MCPVHDDDGNGRTLAWRVGNLERRTDYLYALEPAVVSNDVKGLHEQMDDVLEELRGVRRALIGLLITVAGGAVVFAVTVFQVWGH